MRTLPLTLAAAISLAGVSSAQAVFEIYPGVTSFTSRGNIGTGSGEIHQGFHASINRGLGDNAGVCEVNGVRVLLQDQDRLTQGQWRNVFRSGSDAAGPGTTSADVIATTGLLSFPPASTGTGGWAFLFTVNFSTPVQVPCSDFWSLGVELFPEAWSSDGVSCHASTNAANLQHPNAEDIAWQIVGTATSATHPSSMRSWRIAPIVGMAMQAACNQTTAPNDRFGIGGYFPDTSQVGATSQGISLKVTHPSGAAATGYVLLSIGYDANPFTVFGINNTVYLEQSLIAPFVVASGPADGSVIPFIVGGMDLLAPGGGINVALQSIVVDVNLGTADMTNAVSVVLN